MSARRYTRGSVLNAPASPSVTTLGEMADRAYPDPRPFDSAEAFARQNHDDVPSLGDEELVNELLLARLRRATSARPSQWLMSRIARLSAEVVLRERQQA